MKKTLFLSFSVFLFASLYGQIKKDLINYGYPLMKLGKPDSALFIGHHLSTNQLAKTSDLPISVDNSAFMPPVLDQGMAGTCTGFPVAYALGEVRNKQTGYSLDNQFSPAFIYNMSNGQNNGSLIWASLVAAEAGCAKLADFPYTAGDWQTLPDYRLLNKAIGNSVKDLQWFCVGDSLAIPGGYRAIPGYTGINQARAFLAAGQPVAMSIYLTAGYGAPMAADNWIYSYSAFGNLPFIGGHALCLVGYNDTLQTKDGPGAFLMINSWGTDVFNQGYCWITYKMMAMTNFGENFYTFAPRSADYQPEFKVEFHLKNFVNLSCPFYSGFKVNGQNHQKWLWSYRWNNVDNWNGVTWYRQPVPDSSIVDMTDLVQYVDTASSQDNKFFISGFFWKSLFGSTFPEIESLHLIDAAKGIDTLITTNLVIHDSVFYAEWSFKTGKVTGINDHNYIPIDFSLSQNYPNPFNPTTTINFSLPKHSLVTLKIYDLLGREVSTLVNEEMSSGQHTVKFDASKLSSGLYIYQLNAGNFSSNKKMMLLK